MDPRINHQFTVLNHIKPPSLITIMNHHHVLDAIMNHDQPTLIRHSLSATMVPRPTHRCPAARQRDPRTRTEGIDLRGGAGVKGTHATREWVHHGFDDV